jgi:ketosteroid isomerase-like protein
MDNSDIREALDRHWAASDANDFDAEHEIYQEDATLEYPQSGKRIRGRSKIRASRAAQPNAKRFQVRRIHDLVKNRTVRKIGSGKGVRWGLVE